MIRYRETNLDQLKDRGHGPCRRPPAVERIAVRATGLSIAGSADVREAEIAHPVPFPILNVKASSLIEATMVP
jgi:hypothetical protein